MTTIEQCAKSAAEDFHKHSWILESEKEAAEQVIAKHFAPVAELQALLIRLAVSVKEDSPCPKAARCVTCDILAHPLVAAAIKAGAK